MQTTNHPTTKTAAMSGRAESAAETAPAKRKSRPLRRKTSHSVIERRRREKINEGLIQLQATVPACRDELRGLLEAKVMAKISSTAFKRATAAGKDLDVSEEVDKLMEEKIEKQMILEKLCIISHTVDFVQELQEKLAAYRRLCRCSPPLVATLQKQDLLSSKQHQHHLDMHEHINDSTQQVKNGVLPEEDEESEGDPNRNQASSSTDVARQEAEESLLHMPCCGAKRKRHWGSNNPLDIKNSDTPTAMVAGKRGRLGKDNRNESRIRPRRKAAPSSFDMETSESVPDDEEAQVGEGDDCDNHGDDNHIACLDMCRRHDREEEMLEEEEQSESDHSSDLELEPEPCSLHPSHGVVKQGSLKHLAPLNQSHHPSSSIVASLPSFRSLYADARHLGTTSSSEQPVSPRKESSSSSRSDGSRRQTAGHGTSSSFATPSSFLRRRRATDIGLLNTISTSDKGSSSFGNPVTHACGQIHAPGLPSQKEMMVGFGPDLAFKEVYPQYSQQRRRRSFSPSDRVLPGHTRA